MVPTILAIAVNIVFSVISIQDRMWYWYILNFIIFSITSMFIGTFSCQATIRIKSLAKPYSVGDFLRHAAMPIFAGGLTYITIFWIYESKIVLLLFIAIHILLGYLEGRKAYNGIAYE